MGAPKLSVNLNRMEPDEKQEGVEPAADVNSEEKEEGEKQEA